MTKNLETADVIAKLALAAGTIILFFTRVITGPLANLLTILSCIVIAIFVVRIFIARPKRRH